MVANFKLLDIGTLKQKKQTAQNLITKTQQLDTVGQYTKPKKTYTKYSSAALNTGQMYTHKMYILNVHK